MVSLTRARAEQQINRLRRGLAARLLGPGLLLVHIGVFLVAATALILINLYRHPSGLTIGGALRTWAAIVAFHALIVALYPVVRWSVVTAEIDREDPLQRIRDASTRVRMPALRSPSADGRVPLAARVRANLTQPVSLDAFQGQSVQAIWQRVTVRWQRLTNEQVIPPDMMNGGGQPYHNGHQSTITAESGAYEVVATTQIYGGASSPANAWPRRNGAHSTDGGATASRPASWPQRPGAPVETAHADSERPPAIPAEPVNPDGAAASESSDSPRWAWVQEAAASWSVRPEQDQPELPSPDGERAPASPDTPAPPATE
jgi:hypothetical protein